MWSKARSTCLTHMIFRGARFAASPGGTPHGEGLMVLIHGVAPAPPPTFQRNRCTNKSTQGSRLRPALPFCLLVLEGKLTLDYSMPELCPDLAVFVPVVQKERQEHSCIYPCGASRRRFCATGRSYNPSGQGRSSWHCVARSSGGNTGRGQGRGLPLHARHPLPLAHPKEVMPSEGRRLRSAPFLCGTLRHGPPCQVRRP